MAKRCSRRAHAWRHPRVGDEALECVTCGRALRYSGLDASALVSILKDYAARPGVSQADARAFAEALRAAAAPLYKRPRQAPADSLRIGGFPARAPADL